jgi:hypothetical protein
VFDVAAHEFHVNATSWLAALSKDAAPAGMRGRAFGLDRAMDTAGALLGITRLGSTSSSTMSTIRLDTAIAIAGTVTVPGIALLQAQTLP